MRPIIITAGPLASASATNIRTASPVAGAGAVTLNGSLVTGGIAVLDNPRRVLITSGGNDSGITFTLTGKNSAGDTLTEVVAGTNGSSAYSVLDYKQLTSVVASGASAGNVSIGTNGVGGSPWVMLDPWAFPGVALQLTVSGTVNYTVQQTLDDPNDPTSPVAAASVTWVDSADTNVVAATSTQQTNYAFAPRYVRVRINSGTGSVTATISQFGVVPK